MSEDDRPRLPSLRQLGLLSLRLPPDTTALPLSPSPYARAQSTNGYQSSAAREQEEQVLPSALPLPPNPTSRNREMQAIGITREGLAVHYSSRSGDRARLESTGKVTVPWDAVGHFLGDARVSSYMSPELAEMGRRIEHFTAAARSDTAHRARQSADMRPVSQTLASYTASLSRSNSHYAPSSYTTSQSRTHASSQPPPNTPSRHSAVPARSAQPSRQDWRSYATTSQPPSDREYFRDHRAIGRGGNSESQSQSTGKNADQPDRDVTGGMAGVRMSVAELAKRRGSLKPR